MGRSELLWLRAMSVVISIGLTLVVVLIVEAVG